MVGEETLVAYLLHILHERRDAMVAVQELKATAPKMPKDSLQDLPQRLLEKTAAVAAGHDRGVADENTASKSSPDEGSTANHPAVHGEGMYVPEKDEKEAASRNADKEAASRNVVEGLTLTAPSRPRDWSVDEVVDLVEAASGAAGKPEPERTRMACRCARAQINSNN